MLASELHSILIHEERDERAYELNTLFDETLEASDRLHVDLLPIAAAALQKAADLSRVDLWCTLAAAAPVIEKAGVAVALWNSMQATARWWDIQWYSPDTHAQ